MVTLSGPDGYIYDPDGVATEEKIAYLVEMRSSGRNRVQDYAEKFGVEFFPGEKPWGVKADVVMPSAMQNDVHMEQAKQIAANGVKYYIEVANMPTTNDAFAVLDGAAPDDRGAQQGGERRRRGHQRTGDGAEQ